MCGVIELEHHNDIMATNCPEMWAFRMAVGILEDRNNHIGRQGGVRMLVFPPILEHTIASNVIDLRGAFRFSERVGDIGMSQMHA
jgi:hypothetical protein